MWYIEKEWGVCVCECVIKGNLSLRFVLKNDGVFNFPRSEISRRFFECDLLSFKVQSIYRYFKGLFPIENSCLKSIAMPLYLIKNSSYNVKIYESLLCLCLICKIMRKVMSYNKLNTNIECTWKSVLVPSGKVWHHLRSRMIDSCYTKF